MKKISCHYCQNQFNWPSTENPLFCPFCGCELVKLKPHNDNSVREEEPLLSDRYQLLESIGKGGMGEVFLAYDKLCGRRIALKKIRSDLLEHPQIRHRFLKEAHVTSQLTHPAIIPIYSIQGVQLSAFYTMPFVEGETLKQIIRKTRHQEKKGEKLNHLGSSIPALMRIFTTICQAVAYAHARGVLHRDLKPENIIIGKYGEVLILDWGLAKFIREPQADDEETLSPLPISLPQKGEITKLGRVVGTVSYMAPERALGQPATIQTDIYSLGVILYQLLTLKSPFNRGTLQNFRKNIDKEEYIDPVIAAPYRDVPRVLAKATEKCLSTNIKERYESVSLLIHDLENYLEGRSEWFKAAELDIKSKEHWQFQEHVLIAEHIAITRITEEAEWVNLMISHQSFASNIRIETSIKLGESGHGIGILLSVPEASERKYITDGYCLWLSSDLERSTKLLRSNVEVMQAPDIFLKRNQWIKIRIEKIDNSIHLYLDDILQFSYIAHLPLIGTHIALLSRDIEFEIEPLNIYVGSLNLTVNCLAVPDAFLAHRDFAQALSEYRRIAYSFPDRAEGREAIFRAGLTFIEQAKSAADKTLLLDQALQEFEQLHGTPGGPLEYLGKALVYQILNENEEEIKCFEIAYRRYPKHPLLPVLQEQILSRTHEVSRQQRIASYRFILLSVRHLTPSAIDTHTKRLFTSLQKHWEHLPFLDEQTTKLSFPNNLSRFSIILAFWLAQPYTIGEMIENMLKLHPIPTQEIVEALICLIELGSWDYAHDKMMKVKFFIDIEIEFPSEDLSSMLDCHSQSLDKVYEKLFSTPYTKLNFSKMRTLLYFLDQALDRHQTALVHKAIHALEHCELSFDARLRINLRKIWALLLDRNWQQAGELIYAYPVELLNRESTPLHFLYGCWLLGTEGKEIAMVHLSGIMQANTPRSWTLASQELTHDLLKRGWLDRAFLWEKRQLYKQLSLFHHCEGNDELSKHFFELYKLQYIYAESE